MENAYDLRSRCVEHKEDFKLTKEETLYLYDYFMKRAGYISYEFDMPIHDIIKKIRHYLELGW